MPTTQSQLQPGVYNSQYFSGAQMGLYIGDVWVDEVVSLSFEARQSRSPIFGYSSPLFDDMAKGQIMIQGELTINFKEAGYLWLILNRHGSLQNGQDLLKAQATVGTASAATLFAQMTNVQDILQRYASSRAQQNQNLKALTAQVALDAANQARKGQGSGSNTPNDAAASSIISQLQGLLWGVAANQLTNQPTRRADDPQVNPFDLYITYGDITGPAGVHSTVQKLQRVYIVGTAKQVTLDNVPILETYQFIANDLI